MIWNQMTNPIFQVNLCIKLFKCLDNNQEEMIVEENDNELDLIDYDLGDIDDVVLPTNKR